MTEHITMADVARAAGVSVMTVSRVINDKGDVSPETRRHVQEVIERLGYRRSDIARSLATRRTGTVGLVVPDVANPFFSDVARGVEQRAYDAGYNVFLCNTGEDPEREQTVLRSLEEKRVDGLVLCSSRLSEDELLAVVEQPFSVVLVNRPLLSERVGSVLLDDERGGRVATQHLLRGGRRAPGFLAGPEVSHSGRQRAKGYRAALAAAGMPYYPDRVQPCLPVVEGGYQAARRLLDRHPELDALFCYNDLVAIGALRACAELGRRVPTDVAVVGYDDIPLAALVTPSLTTCRVPRYDLGAEAMRLLLAQIEGSSAEGEEIVLPSELIIRASAP